MQIDVDSTSSVEAILNEAYLTGREYQRYNLSVGRTNEIMAELAQIMKQKIANSIIEGTPAKPVTPTNMTSS